MIKDRGIIKWQGMILTEHKNMLKALEAENVMVKRPELEEWEITLIAEEVERAFKSKSTIKLTYWRDGELKDDYGIPIEINTTNKSIVIDDPFGMTRYPINEIVDASIVD